MLPIVSQPGFLFLSHSVFKKFTLTQWIHMGYFITWLGKCTQRLLS